MPISVALSSTSSLVGRLVEVGARGHLDAERVVEEGHRVEVGLQDLVLGVDRLDLQRGDRLLGLAVQRHGAADLLRVQVARQLLRDGGAALRLPRSVFSTPPRCAASRCRGARRSGGPRWRSAHRPPAWRSSTAAPTAVDALELGQHHAVGRHHHASALRTWPCAGRRCWA
jgi:hypothetical protein